MNSRAASSPRTAHGDLSCRLTYVDRGGQALLLDVLASDDAVHAPVVRYVHGGGWSGGDRGAGMHPWLSPLLASHGYLTAFLNYRLSGEASWPAQRDDVADAVGWLRATPANWVPVAGAGHDWADLPSARGYAESAGTFGSAALAFFDAHLR